MKKPPIEYCPECLSLKRKPNKECVNHSMYWSEGYRLDDAVNELSTLMVKNIANKHIKVDDTHEGKRHQRHWYLEAQKMLKRLVKEYEKSLKEAYNK